MSDVATILARRVAVEFSDSDDCASESEYDSDDWGKRDEILIVWNNELTFVQVKQMLDRGEATNPLPLPCR